jgi:hypothetical protein
LVGIADGASSSISDDAQSGGEINGLIGKPGGEHPSSVDFAHDDASGYINAQNGIATFSLESSTVCVLMRRLNSACCHLMPLAARALYHRRVKANKSGWPHPCRR